MQGYCNQSIRIAATNKENVLSALVFLANLKKGKTREKILSGDGIEKELQFFSQETIIRTGANFPLSYINPDIIVKKCENHYHIQIAPGIDPHLINYIPKEIQRLQEKEAKLIS